MSFHPSSVSNTEPRGSFVNKLSLQDSSMEAFFAKFGVAWLGFFAGISLTDIFTLASIIWVLLNIFVLVRDKIWRKRAAKASQHETDFSSGD